MKRFLAFFMSFLFFFGITVYAEEIEEPKDLYAGAAVLMDAESGRVLFEKNGTEVLAMASTTKIMTCILALEEGNMEDAVTISENAASQPKVHLGMKVDEQFYLKDLLYSLMLESHNDSAVAIAEHIGGTTEQFAKRMNQKAIEIGCTNTHFITPNGLDAVDEDGIHATTATDLARIMSYCIMASPKRDEFLQITAMANYSFTNVEGSRSFTCSNKNSFLYMFDGAISGKTGFTGKAGYCYVGAVKRDDRTFVVALLACGWPNNKNYKWKDSAKLMEYAIENYVYQDVYEKIELPKLEVDGGIPQSRNMFEKAYVNLEIAAVEDGLQLLLRKDENVEVITEYPDEINAPISRGDVVGKVYYYLNQNKVKEYDIVSSENVDKKDFSWYFKQISKKYFGG